MTEYRQDVANKLREILTYADSKIVWLPRTPEFYAASFARAYDPYNAADEWNRTRAGGTPRWQYDAARGDFMCQAHKRKASLKEICAALGVDYPPQRIAVDKQVKDYNRTRARKAIVTAVELKDGHPVWARRTRKTHPRTDQLLLDEFNRDYAGKPLRLHHKSGMYRIAFRLVTHEELMQWLKEKEAK